MIRAPWTQEQVDKLNEWQNCGVVHPFTCGKRNRETHRTLDAIGDFGVLIATKTGWICPDCDYKQDWAHDFMFQGVPESLKKYIEDVEILAKKGEK